jgi:phosphate acetyltransferase
MTPEKARPILAQPNYFGTMLVKMGIADCLLGGATYSTADTVRPALQIIKTKPGNSIVSSCFILVRAAATGGREVIAMGDCAININPSEDDLVEICGETAECARVFGIDPKVAFLSFSTAGSAKDPSVTKVQNATKKAKAKYPNIPIDGEMQFDAAVSPRVGQQKMPGSQVAGYANTFIFPDINAGNLGYKIASQFVDVSLGASADTCTQPVHVASSVTQLSHLDPPVSESRVPRPLRPFPLPNTFLRGSVPSEESARPRPIGSVESLSESVPASGAPSPE